MALRFKEYNNALDFICMYNNAQPQYRCMDCDKSDILELCSARFTQTDKGEQLQFFCPDCHKLVNAVHESFYA